jgi:hypothetical protein
MDPSDGEIRFRTSVDVEHAPEAFGALLRNLLGLNLGTVRRHYQVLVVQAEGQGRSASEGPLLPDNPRPVQDTRGHIQKFLPAVVGHGTSISSSSRLG